MKKYESVGLLRFAGAVSIFAFHYYQIVCQNDYDKLPFPNLLRNWAINGHIAVELFFMLSGFFMAYNHEDNIIQDTFGNFVFNKLKRLWVPTFASSLIGLFVLMPEYTWGGLYNLFINASLTSTNWVETNSFTYNGVTWYINSLMVCYIVYFVLVKLCEKKKDLLTPLKLLIVVFGLGG